MKRIYAISDGCFQKNKKIDQTLVHLLNKENPRILFLPMPLEMPDYPVNSLNNFVAQFQNRYQELGCQVDVLFTRDNPTKEQIREKVLAADAVYVGPGHVPTMMEKMKQFGFDEILKEAYEKGTMMAGMSAGAMCCFEPYLGFVKAPFYPHYQGFERIESGYAAKDPSATLFVDGHVGQIVKLSPEADVYQFKVINGTRKSFRFTSPDNPYGNSGR